MRATRRQNNVLLGVYKTGLEVLGTKIRVNLPHKTRVFDKNRPVKDDAEATVPGDPAHAANTSRDRVEVRALTAPDDDGIEPFEANGIAHGTAGKALLDRCLPTVPAQELRRERQAKKIGARADLRAGRSHEKGAILPVAARLHRAGGCRGAEAWGEMAKHGREIVHGQRRLGETADIVMPQSVKTCRGGRKNMQENPLERLAFVKKRLDVSECAVMIVCEEVLRETCDCMAPVFPRTTDGRCCRMPQEAAEPRMKPRNDVPFRETTQINTRRLRPP